MRGVIRYLYLGLAALLIVSLPWAGAAKAESAPDQPKALPLVGVVMIQTDALRAENNAKPMDMIRSAVDGKLTAIKQTSTVVTLADSDFTSYLGKKDIMPDSTGLLRELKLPVLVEYGQRKNLDFLLLVIGDSKVAHHMKTNINHTRDKDGKIIFSNTNDTDEVDYADVTLRTAYVDVKKGEYVLNLTLTQRSGPPALWGNAVRSVNNDACTRVINEFNQKATL